MWCWSAGAFVLSISGFKQDAFERLKILFWIPFSLLAPSAVTELHEKDEPPELCLRFQRFVQQLLSLFLLSSEQLKLKACGMCGVTAAVQHDHLKSPQDPWCCCGSQQPCAQSSGYCMPFHLAACCSRTVNSLIAGWKLWKRTRLTSPPPSTKPVQRRHRLWCRKPLFSFTWTECESVASAACALDSRCLSKS